MADSPVDRILQQREQLAAENAAARLKQDEFFRSALPIACAKVTDEIQIGIEKALGNPPQMPISKAGVSPSFKLVGQSDRGIAVIIEGKLQGDSRPQTDITQASYALMLTGEIRIGRESRRFTVPVENDMFGKNRPGVPAAKLMSTIVWAVETAAK